MSAAPTPEALLFCGDPHGKFGHIVELASLLRQQAVVLGGDMEPPRVLQDEMAPLATDMWLDNYSYRYSTVRRQNERSRNSLCNR